MARADSCDYEEVSAPLVSERAPSEWVDDLRWHQHMFQRSWFRWVPEDPLTLVLSWTDGRLEYQSLSHLTWAQGRLHQLSSYAGGIDREITRCLVVARETCAPSQWTAGLELMQLDPPPNSLSNSPYQAQGPSAEVRRIQRHVPLLNPMTTVWELRQMRSLYHCAEDLLDDVICDLALELHPEHGWSALQEALGPPQGRDLYERVQLQRARRGEPGDPRRRSSQRY